MDTGGVSSMAAGESFKEFARIINAYFPPPPDRGYVGNRCGWYPEKPKRKRKGAA
jgi:hypothetical protein